MIIVSGRDTNEVLSELDIHANTTAAGSNVIMLNNPKEESHYANASLI